MKKLLLILAMFCVCDLNAQTIGSDANRKSETPGSGHFNINVTTAKGTEHWNVLYAVYPLQTKSELNIFLRTFNSITLSADIVDAAGTKVLSWTPGTASYKYRYSWDVSKLAPGKYNVIIYDQNNTKMKTVSFEKV